MLHLDEYQGNNYLEQYTESLLFDSDELIAAAYFSDEDGNTVKLYLGVAGEKKIALPKDPDTSYRYANEYPEELVRAIKEGVMDRDYIVSMNNWFSLDFEITDEDGKILADDDEPWEDDISKRTNEELKNQLISSAIDLYAYYVKGHRKLQHIG